MLGMGSAGEIATRAVENIEAAHTAFIEVRDKVSSANGNAGALVMNGYSVAKELTGLLESVLSALRDSEAALLQAKAIATELKES